MLRILAVALLFVLVSGCFSTGGGGGAPETAPSSTSTSPVPVAPPVPRTDILHLLDPPHMAGALPDVQQPVRTYVPSEVDNLEAPAIPPAWMLPRPGLTELEVTLTLVVEVEGTVTNPPRPAIGIGLPTSNCFWSFKFFLEHADGERTGLTSYCRLEEPVLPAGVRTMEERFVLTPDEPLFPGDRFGFAIDTRGVYGPDSGVYVLSGTAEHDSTMTVLGLQLPIDTRTLLI